MNFILDRLVIIQLVKWKKMLITYTRLLYYLMFIFKIKMFKVGFRICLFCALFKFDNNRHFSIYMQ